MNIDDDDVIFSLRFAGFLVIFFSADRVAGEGRAALSDGHIQHYFDTRHRRRCKDEQP